VARLGGGDWRLYGKPSLVSLFIATAEGMLGRDFELRVEEEELRMAARPIPTPLPPIPHVTMPVFGEVGAEEPSLVLKLLITAEVRLRS
jgi:hypothetical protein